MPEPELGRIFWSPRAQNFFQEGRVGAVPRLEALSSLIERPFGGATRLFDQRGRALPRLESLIPDRFGRIFEQSKREANLTAVNVYRARAPKNSYYATLAVFRTAEGKLDFVLRNNKANKAVSRSKEASNIAREINLREPDKSKRKETEKRMQQVTAIFHYLLR